MLEGQRKTIFMTGVTGFLGTALLKKFPLDKYNVRALVRQNGLSKKFKGVSLVVGDLRDKNTLKGCLTSIETVIHTAGVVTDWAPKSLYREVHIEGTRNLLEEAIRSGVKKFIFISTTDVLDYTIPGKLNENSPKTKIRDGYAGTKKEAEEMLLSYHNRGLIEVVIIRPAWIYGENDTTFIPEIVYQTRKNAMVIVGDPSNLIPLVHVENLAELIKKASETELKDKNIFIAVDGHISWKNLTDKVAKAVNSTRKIPKIPYSLAYGLACLLELFAHTVASKKRPLLTRASVKMIGKNIELDASTTQKILKYEPKVDFKTNLDAVITQISLHPEEELKKK